MGSLSSDKMTPCIVAVCEKDIQNKSVKKILIIGFKGFYFLKKVDSNLVLFPTLSVTINLKLFCVG